jgi:hypothetical protein
VRHHHHHHRHRHHHRRNHHHHRHHPRRHLGHHHQTLLVLADLFLNLIQKKKYLLGYLQVVGGVVYPTNLRKNAKYTIHVVDNS